MPVYTLQVSEIVGREVEVQLAGSDFREVALSLMESTFVSQAKTIT